MLVRGPWIFRNRAFEVKALARRHVVYVLGHWAIRIAFDE